MSSNDYVWKNDFIDSYDTFLFDCDGVLWHENDVIGGAVKVIGELIQLKKRVIFITNNSGKSRREYADKIISMGFPIQKATESVEELVLCSSFALAQYLKKLSTNPITTGDDSGKKSFNHEVDKVLVIGDSGIGLELGYENIQFVDTRQMFPNHLSRAQLAKLPLDPTIRAVAVGIDDQLTYTKVAYAVAHLKADPTILFISTNDDANLPTAGECPNIYFTYQILTYSSVNSIFPDLMCSSVYVATVKLHVLLRVVTDRIIFDFDFFFSNDSQDMFYQAPVVVSL